MAMLQRGEYKNMLADPNRSDYALRLGNGKSLMLRGSLRLKDLFPDGMKVTPSKQDGVWHLELQNRASGYYLSTETNNDVEYVHMTLHEPGKQLPPFGSVSPQEVINIKNGGLLVILPEELPPLRGISAKGKGLKATKAAKPKAAPKAAKPVDNVVPNPQPSAQPTPTPQATPQPEPQAAPKATTQRTTAPEIEIGAAIRALNAWKAIMGDDLGLSIGVNGGVVADVVYR